MILNFIDLFKVPKNIVLLKSLNRCIASTRNGTNISIAVMFAEKYAHMVLLPETLFRKERRTKMLITTCI